MSSQILAHFTWHMWVLSYYLGEGKERGREEEEGKGEGRKRKEWKKREVMKKGI